MRNYLKIYKTYEEFCQYQKEIRKNKFLFFLRNIFSYTLSGLVWALVITWFVSLIVLIFAPIGLFIIPFTSLTFETYALIIGESFIYAYLTTIFLIIIYTLLSIYIKIKSGLDIDSYIDVLKEWKEKCKNELKKEKDYIDVDYEEEHL